MSDSNSASNSSGRAPDDKTPSARKKGMQRILLLSLPAFFFTAVAIAAMVVHLPTNFQTELVTRQLEIVPRENLTLDFAGFTSLRMEEFREFSLTPESLGVREEEEGDWKSFDFKDSLTFTGEEGLSASLRLHGGAGGDSVGNLRLDIQSGRRVTFSTQAGGKELMIAVRQMDEAAGAQPARAEIDLFSTRLFRITAHNLELADVELPVQSDVLHYLVSVAEHSSAVAFEPLGDQLVTIVRPGDGQSGAAFPRGGIPVDSVNLLRFNNRDKRFESALVAGGTLSRDRVAEEIKFDPADQLHIKDPDELRVRVVGLDSEAGGLRLQIEGRAGRLALVTAGGKRDMGVTLFQMLWENQQLSVIFGILFWALSTSFGLYNLYKKFTEAKKD